MPTLTMLKRSSLIFIVFLTFISLDLVAQITNNLVVNVNINWQNTKIPVKYNKPNQNFISFRGAFLNNTNPYKSIYQHIIACPDSYFPTASITVKKSSLVTDTIVLRQISVHRNTPTIEIGRINKDQVSIYMDPFFKTETGEIYKVESFDLNISKELFTVKTSNNARAKNAASNSVLSSGKWNKVGVTKSGIVKLDYGYLTKSRLVNNSNDLKNFQVYGKPGGSLPELNGALLDDDLVENAIKVVDNNGVWDGDDYVLFYAAGPTLWVDDDSIRIHKPQYYCDTAYYFLTRADNSGKRIQSIPAGPLGTNTVNWYDDAAIHEVDNITDISKELLSGKQLFGEEFRSLNGTTQVEREFIINTPGAKSGDIGLYKMVFAARSDVSTSLDIYINGNFSKKITLDQVRIQDQESPYADVINVSGQMTYFGSETRVKLVYNKTTSISTGWLDYIELTNHSKLASQQGQIIYLNTRSKSIGKTNEYTVDISKTGNNLEIWDITDFHNASLQQFDVNGNTARYSASANDIRKYIMYSGNDFMAPIDFGTINNQNLHGLLPTDMVIISHPKFIKASERLAKFHLENDGFTTSVVTPQQIYNEFSSGSPDPMAFRLFMKMQYERGIADPSLKQTKYLLLFGDGSYDLKNKQANNTNYVPTYQTTQSIDPIGSFCSDDFYGSFESGKGNWSSKIYSVTNGEFISLGIGRFPVNTEQQADVMVDKVIAYYKPSSRGAWRNKITWVGDDEDGNDYMQQSNTLCNESEKDYPYFNGSKVFLDAYKQVSVASGNRYPDVNTIIDQSVTRGTLILNYIGHGREAGLAHERILEIPQINSWKNMNNLPVIVTATCEFSRYDDPAYTSAGELCLLNPNGGAIAMLTTTRVVFSSSNFYLLQNLYYNNIFDRDVNGKGKRLGDVVRQAKNLTADDNCRNFSLLGDPALRLALPQEEVVITEIDADGGSLTIDTINALSKVKISGEVRRNGAIISDFDGVVYLEFYDKVQIRRTLANDPDNYPITFETQDNVVYKGSATVKAGKFDINFVAPLDINFQIGTGKANLYAYKMGDNTLDAAGYNDTIQIGGANKSAIPDDKGPIIALYMNDTNFRNMGLTNENPTMLAKVYDQSGLNYLGTSIGHDMIAYLDGNLEINVNDFYQADLDNYQRGKINYPFNNLTNGQHSLKLRVWDVANNSSEANLDFVVARSENIRIDKIINFPNPFSDQTTFSFEHNQPNTDLFVDLEIISTQGVVVKQISQKFNNAGTKNLSFKWDGSTNSNGKVATGLYLYKLIVRNAAGQVTSYTSKLMIL